MRSDWNCGRALLVVAVLLGCGDSADDSGVGTDTDAAVHPDSGGADLTLLDDEQNGPRPAAEFLPAATGPCPGFVDGELCESDDVSLICSFEPEGVAARKVRLWLPDATPEIQHPVVFFFHGMGQHAEATLQSPYGLGKPAVDAMVAEGAIVVALEQEEGRTISPTMQPWKTAVQDGLLEADQEGRFDDLLVMDEVLACAEETLGVNSRRIHATGLSAGGLMTSNLIYRRNGYLASLAPFSGGIMGRPTEQDPERHAPVMYSWGGETDMAVGQDFNVYAMDAIDRLETNGNWFMLCNHGGGHAVNPELPAPMWQFFKDHPYGVDPEPYAAGPSDAFPDYCTLP
jgi:predicted esterase